MQTCPVCGGRFSRQVADAEEIVREFDIQRDFVLERLHHNASPEELKDLIDFMHDAPAALLRCSGCGLLSRAEAQPEDAGSYEEDPNDPDVMAQVYPRYLQAFRNKEPGYRDLLRPHAEVLELGSHLGGFLQAAEEWNWRPIGVDVGSDTTAFVRRNGLTVLLSTLEDSRLRPGSFEAVFVWNCFEQLPNPVETLVGIRRMLARHGLVVLRVPNERFYRALRGAGEAGKKALAYNNLLGFPYLYGYSEATLNRLARCAGFEPVRAFNSELVTTPFADVPEKLEREQKQVSRSVKQWSSQTSRQELTLTGPWIEVVYRRTDEPAKRSPRIAADPLFLERAVA